MNEIKQKRLPAPRFGHAATKYFIYIHMYVKKYIESLFVLDTLEDLLCMAVS